MISDNDNNSHAYSEKNGQISRFAKRNIIAQDEGLTAEALAALWAKRAYEYAAPPQAEVTGDTLNLLVFLMNDERYGIEVRSVREIYPLGQITIVPRTPDFVVGVFSARGRLISVVDLRAFFGLTKVNLTAETKIVVVADETSGMEVGFVADEVEDVMTVFTKDLEPALTTQMGSRAHFTQGIAPGMLVVLNLVALLNDKQLIVHEEIM